MSTIIDRLEEAKLTFEALDSRIGTEDPRHFPPVPDEDDGDYVPLLLEAAPDLLKLARAASRLRIEEVAGVGTVIVAWPDVKAALESLLRKAQEGA